MSSQNDNAREHLTGRVKWFNNKSGYGFVTVTDGSRSGTDVFVHHSDINVDSQQYKYLVQGEYIEFDLIKLESSKHEWQASNVSGIRGGKLMCETRRESKIARTEYKSVNSDSENVEIPKQKPVSDENNKREFRVRVRGEGPRDSSNKSEWNLVGNKPNNRKPRSDKNTKSKQSSTIITIQSK
jgi:cold shock CspA family protein